MMFHKGPSKAKTTKLDTGTTATEKRATRAVEYIRVSTDEQAQEGVSLDAQRAKLQAYALAMDIELVGIVEDQGRSASTLDRRGLKAALAMLTQGRADAVLITKLDRLTRSVKDLGSLVERYFASGQYSLPEQIGVRRVLELFDEGLSVLAGVCCAHQHVGLFGGEAEAFAEALDGLAFGVTPRRLLPSSTL